MFYKLFLLFTIVPVIELYFLIKIGSIIGAFNTIMVILLTAIVGAWLARMQGLMVLGRIYDSLEVGQMPGYDIFQGLFILIGSFSLLTPGFITDLIGLSMLIPVSRAFYIKLITIYFKKKLDSRNYIHFTDI